MPQVRRVFEYLLDKEPANIDHDNPIVVLGQEYSPIYPKLPSQEPSEPSTAASSSLVSAGERPVSQTSDQGHEQHQTGANSSARASSNEWPADFLQDVESRIWLTYRQSFSLIERAANGPAPVSISNISNILRGNGLDMSGFTSDAGWGCMIRTSQSLLANTLVTLHLGRNWRRHTAMETIDGDEHLQEQQQQKRSGCEEEPIIKLFADTPDAPFSVHRIVAHGQNACGKMPGQWFGPSAAASSIKHIVEKFNSELPTTGLSFAPTTKTQSRGNHNLHVYISCGTDIYEDLLMNTATSNHSRSFEPTLVLLGVRLGTDKFNAVYWPNLQRLLASRFAVGIAGGRPSASHYFYGYQGEYLFYQDPHKSQPCLKPHEQSGHIDAQLLDTCHSKRIRRLHYSDMDPSMLVGILLKDADEYLAWKTSIEETQAQKGSIITISKHEPVLRRSSLSVGSDDGFIEVGSDGEEEEEEEEVGDQHESEPEDDDIEDMCSDSHIHDEIHPPSDTRGEDSLSDGSYIQHEEGINGRTVEETAVQSSVSQQSPSIGMLRKRPRSPPEMIARSFDCVEVTEGGSGNENINANMMDSAAVLERRVHSAESYENIDLDDADADSFAGILV